MRLPAAALALALVAVAAAWPRRPSAACAGARTPLDTAADCGACGLRCAAEHARAACVAGRCQLTCEPGHADCDGHPGNGCEAELATDRHHCGLCGRDCAGAACVNGQCAARYLGRGLDVSADDKAAYLVGRHLALRVPLDGSEPGEVLLDAVPPASRGDLATADGPGEGGRVLLGAATLVEHPVRVRRLAANATHVFWVDARGRVFMAAKKR
jgi:hypothetical protein